MDAEILIEGGNAMNSDEKKVPTPDEAGSADASPAEENVQAFLDSVPGDSADDFLEKLYQDSFADLTSDFDSLLQEFRSIDPDELAVPADKDAPQAEEAQMTEAASASADAKPEMEDIYSYSDHSPDDPTPHKNFTDAVQQAMEAELSQQDEATGDTFRISLDKIDGRDGGLGEAMEAAAQAQPQSESSTRIFSAVDPQAAAGAQPRPQQPRSQQPPRPAQTAPAKKDGKKRSFLLPQKTDSTFEIFRKILFLVSIAVVVVCLGIIGNIYLLQPALEKRRQADVEKLRGESVSDAASFEQAYGTELPSGVQRYNLAQYYAANPDFYGYLEIPGTSISMPVVQGKDNSKYLRRNFFGESTKYGCPFVNYKNTYSALDYNTSIFGHNMEYDNLVFGDLENYRKIDGFKKAPLIHLETMFADHYFKIYAVFLTDAKYSNGWYFDYIFTQLKDEAECKEYIAQLDQRKLYSTGVDIQPTDKLLTLSTCSYDFDDERLVVVGRLVREGEDNTVDTSKAVANNNPRYPDRYYQKKGLTNPYLNADKWIPNA